MDVAQQANLTRKASTTLLRPFWLPAYSARLYGLPAVARTGARATEGVLATCRIEDESTLGSAAVGPGRTGLPVRYWQPFRSVLHCRLKCLGNGR